MKSTLLNYLFYMKERVSDNTIKSIVKFINAFFNPIDVKVRDVHGIYGLEKSITVFVGSISDEYIENPNSGHIEYHKVDMLTRKIREYIEDYLGIETYGRQLSINFLSHVESHPIQIEVVNLHI